MKRVDWDPNGERNTANRGKSGYERISWEEALELVSSEIKRVQTTYGNHALTGMTSSHHNWGTFGYRFGPFERFVNMLDSTRIVQNPDSWEGWIWGAAHMWGNYWRLGILGNEGLLIDFMRNSTMMVMWSADPDSTRAGYNGQDAHLWREWIKDTGIPTVVIDPFYNYTAAHMDSTWISPLPGTDCAIAAAIAYIWLIDDTYDKWFIENRTIGFEKFKDYILGVEDGVPKTPEWAEQESTVPARIITALARKWAKEKVMLNAGMRGCMGGACRTAYGHEWTRFMIALQSMQGLGKPGVNFWGTNTGAPTNRDIFFPGYSDVDGHIGEASYADNKFTPATNKTKQFLMRLSVPDAVLNGRDEWFGEGMSVKSLEQQFVKHIYPIEGEVHMFYRYGGSHFGTMTNTNKWAEMYRSPKLECVVNQDCWTSGESQFADIILPACTQLEREDIAEWAAAGGYTPGSESGLNWRVIVREQKCIEPLGESKSDYEILRLISAKLGKEELFTEGKSEVDWIKQLFMASDLHKQNLISWDEFDRKGYFLVPPPAEQADVPIELQWYREGRPCDVMEPANPKKDTDKAHELGTYSGKIEFESQSIITHAQPDDERLPVPRYIPSWEGTRSELYKTYPLQLVCPHPRFTYHTHYDTRSCWLDEIPGHRQYKEGYAYWTVRISYEDAQERGIQGGDLVELYNDRGRVICCASLTNRLKKGVIHSYGSCAKYDPLMPATGAPDKGGCVNLLTNDRYVSKNASGMAPYATLCEIRKWDA